MENKVDVCRYCGASNFVETGKSPESVAQSKKFFSLTAQYIYHIICLECGTIHRSFVKQPKKLK